MAWWREAADSGSNQPNDRERIKIGGDGTLNFACPYASLGFLHTSRFETQPPFAYDFQQPVELWQAAQWL